jgi:hypothetical protein
MIHMMSSSIRGARLLGKRTIDTNLVYWN